MIWDRLSRMKAFSDNSERRKWAEMRAEMGGGLRRSACKSLKSLMFGNGRKSRAEKRKCPCKSLILLAEKQKAEKRRLAPYRGGGLPPATSARLPEAKAAPNYQHESEAKEKPGQVVRAVRCGGVVLSIAKEPVDNLANTPCAEHEGRGHDQQANGKGDCEADHSSRALRMAAAGDLART